MIRVMKRTLISLFLGFSRYVSVKRSNYQLIEEEYGPMWNFFYSLASIDVLSMAIVFTCSPLFNSKAHQIVTRL